MDIREINDEYSVSGQITVEDLDQIKALGFKSIVCNRPDEEEPGQPDFAEIEARAKELGLDIRHIPVGRMGLTPEGVTEMLDVLEDFPKPLLGYCRSGARSTAIYEQSSRLRG
ncbi:TIGR01244 family sulfur transferase [Neorhizobium sp. AL 9.2.2]|uniref:TIGR01244 family sulfur transferase n=1 Tax=Neorhizobium sp. AL 9.2.2 TaxID=2712894 RepID=UPI00157301FD|nr:TIGR01244 family sulfur transferase [Neorhizobium sp. AL 9.2.2]NSY17779.1 TIGR01244 family phosphatase [Neorhizobium sp. AL 9.2.2]